MNNFELDVLAYLSKRPLKIIQAGKGKSFPVNKDVVFNDGSIKQLKLADRIIMLEELKKNA